MPRALHVALTVAACSACAVLAQLDEYGGAPDAAAPDGSPDAPSADGADAPLDVPPAEVSGGPDGGAVSYVSAAPLQSADGTALYVPPDSLRVGDVVVAGLYCVDETPAPTPMDWTSLGAAPGSGWITTFFAIVWPSSPHSYTFKCGAASAGVLGTFAYRGADFAKRAPQVNQGVSNTPSFAATGGAFAPPEVGVVFLTESAGGCTIGSGATPRKDLVNFLIADRDTPTDAGTWATFTCTAAQNLSALTLGLVP